MQKLVLKCFLSPGDVVMLTAAVRELHRCYPGRFLTDVRTACPDFWLHNPHLTPLDEADPAVRVIECHYPLINQSNQGPHHFIFGFIEHLNDVLDLRIRPYLARGDLHLSPDEKSAPPPLSPPPADNPPWWIICAGGKYDFTIKWWHWRRYQAVVDHFQGRLRFVQIGEHGHYHPPLRGVIDARGKTTLRELLRLVYHSSGVLCGVTLHMHLAAAVDCPPGRPPLRPCVVVAGGREPPQWEAYPAHQFIHTIGALDCCATGGCWKSRTRPLGDGEPLDEPDQLCRRVVNHLPACMDMITPAHVIERIEMSLRRNAGDPPCASSPSAAANVRHSRRAARPEVRFPT